MIPITRATAHFFCRTCLQELDIVTKQSQKKREIQSDGNLVKWLSVIVGTATSTWNMERQHPRHLCHACYAKVRTFYEFREKVIVSTEALKELLTENLQVPALRNLQKFCRGCLNRLKLPPPSMFNMQELGELMLDLVGVRMGMCVPVKEQFPTKLCSWCYKKLRNFVEFRRVAKDSLVYLESVLDGETENDMDLAAKSDENAHEQEESISKVQQVERSSQNLEEEEIAKGAEIYTEQLPVLDESICVSKKDIGKGTEKNLNSFGDSIWHNGHCEDAAVLDNVTKAASDNSVKTHFISNKHNTFELISIKEEVSNASPGGSVMHELSLISANRRKRKCSLKPGNENKKTKEQTQLKGKTKTDDLKSNGYSTFQQISSAIEMSTASRVVDDEHAIPVTKSTRQGCKRNLKQEISAGKANLSAENKETLLIKCAKCEKKFRKKVMYDAHVRRDHEGNDRPFQCAHCANTFSMCHVMQRHIREAHAVFSGNANNAPVNTKPTCTICCKQFSRTDHLRDHLRAVHQRSRPFKCNYCDKFFGSRKVCRVHEMGHTGQRPFTCEYCARSFRQITDLNIHREQHTTNPELLCPICKRAKSTAAELRQHITEHNERMLQCTKCGKLFRKKSHLHAHDDAVHLKLRPFKCSHCEQTFALHRTCRTHERIHTRPSNKMVPKAT